MKYCANCGSQYNASAAYCPNCGAANTSANVQQAAGVVTQGKKTNGMCIAGFVCSLLCTPIGLILSIIGLVQAKKKDEGGKGLGIAGIIISGIGLVISVVLFLVFFGIGVAYSDVEHPMIKEGCANLDANGNYKSSDGAIVCKDFYCEYETEDWYYSASCDLVDLDEYDYDEDYDYDDEEYYYEDETKKDEVIENKDENITPSVTNNAMANTSWIASDNSEMVFTSISFNWYKDKGVYTDNYYTGTYKFYIGEDAVNYITTELSSYGVTKEELNSLFDRVEEYSVDNFVVFDFSYLTSKLNGQVSTVTENKAPWFGFILKDGTYLDVANMNTGTYYKFNKKVE